MKEMYRSQLRFVLIFAIVVLAYVNLNGQTSMPDELNKNRLKEQLKYVENKTRIYENYRAIREDMFQKIIGNVSDTLTVLQKKISRLNIKGSALNSTIDSLTASLETTKTDLEEVTRSKNSISVLGMEVNKLTYNTIMWTMVAILAAILTLGFMVFKRNMLAIISTNKELKDQKDEFEAYRKTTREAREKASMDHFNELKKLRGG